MKSGTNNPHINSYIYRKSYRHVYMDNTYTVVQMIVTFIILIIGIITFATVRKSDVIDPIESKKSFFINTYLIIVFGFLVIMFLINYLSENELILVKRLKFFLVVSIITMIVLLGIKLNFDSVYTKRKFEEFYTKPNIENELSEDDMSNLRIDMMELRLKTDKQYYVDECLKLYNIFKIKTCAILGLHLILNILVIYQIKHILKIKRKKEIINKDDIILFDEEQNIKF